MGVGDGKGRVFAVGLQARLPWPLSWRPCGVRPEVGGGRVRGGGGPRRQVRDSLEHEAVNL